MRVDSVAELRVAFEVWRSKKRYATEKVPGELVARARRAIGVHGVKEVARATGLERQRLRGTPAGGGREVAPVVAVPSFSRVELAAPAGASRPFAEVETPTGLKLRLFAQTQEALGLLSSLCGAGGGR